MQAVATAGVVGAAVGGAAQHGTAAAAGETLYDKVAALAKAVEALEAKAGASDIKCARVQHAQEGQHLWLRTRTHTHPRLSPAHAIFPNAWRLPACLCRMRICQFEVGGAVHCGIELAK
jgi:hypothetical protein